MRIFFIILTAISLSSARFVSLENEMAKLAEDVTSNVKSSEKPEKSLVFAPLNDSRAPGFAMMVEEFLTVPLLELGKVSVLDRAELMADMKKNELQIMRDKPNLIGEIASANYMITGTVASGFDSNYLITLRLISVGNSKVIGVASVEIPCSELDKRIRRN